MSDIDDGKNLALAGSRAKPLVWLAVIMGIPLVGVIVAVGLGQAYMRGATPEHARLIGSAVVCALVVLMAVLLWSLRRARVRVDQGVLIIHTSVGTKRIPLANLRAHGVHLVNFSTHPELRPVIKLWGTGLPGFAGGWFKLRNGDKAVCLLLDRHGISYLRSDADNLTLLLSLAEPEKLRKLLEH
ncbi:MAG: hypothetical protein KGI64_11835 [Xanthomonadaceae bacterium]|nr:PH domain-containing protein [Xanthomonadaceae bacterium]MDE1885234.1 hypothetical protein [Xanthomonadaceae bacterium]MDE2085534.1 hypothetical protein [Xanthomonadaceae bacterium]MDE2257942.1 hypothetical protein [Xanthomonadaceae bacterium]